MQSKALEIFQRGWLQDSFHEISLFRRFDAKNVFKSSRRLSQPFKKGGSESATFQVAVSLAVWFFRKTLVNNIRKTR